MPCKALHSISFERDKFILLKRGQRRIDLRRVNDRRRSEEYRRCLHLSDASPYIMNVNRGQKVRTVTAASNFVVSWSLLLYWFQVWLCRFRLSLRHCYVFSSLHFHYDLSSCHFFPQCSISSRNQPLCVWTELTWKLYLLVAAIELDTTSDELKAFIRSNTQ